jgi:hypothetical protein
LEAHSFGLVPKDQAEEFAGPDGFFRSHGLKR